MSEPLLIEAPTPVDVLSFTVLGDAQPGGSKRAFKHPHTDRIIVTDANKKAKGWQHVVGQEAFVAMGPRELWIGPLVVEFTFYRPRPNGHYGQGRNAGQVKASAPAYPITRPDVLKLARAAEDALTGIVWRDDAQIVDEVLRKRWGSPARLEVMVSPL